MIYEYYCDNCHTVIEVEKSMKEDIPKSVECPACRLEANRVWKNMTIHIPEFMKAGSTLYNNNSASDYDYVKGRMNKGVRPSGKQKTFY
jgi:putative FmdB family regulatory protein